MNIRGMRIAFFTGAYSHIADGVSLTLNRLVAFLVREGAIVRVYAPTAAVPALQHAGTLVPVPSVSAPGRPEYRISLGFGWRAHENLTDFAPHLFHIATPDLLGLSALRAARTLGTPVVASYHTHFASYLKYYRLNVLEPATWSYLRWFYRQCRAVYVPSKSMTDVLRSHGIDGNLRLWPRGVDSSLFTPARRSDQWRGLHGIDGSTPAITFVSRLVQEKGLDIVVDVMRRLSDDGIPHRAVLVGDGPERANLEASLPNAVFTGHLTGEALATAYASSDIFLFPSDTETFGNVTLEALSSGLPAVVANATGSNDLVENGMNGFLARPRESESFAGYVERLILEPELRHEIGMRARAGAQAYDWDYVLAQMVSYYEEIH
ncbi:MAG TPA: glycosyltransferase family 1 protein [Gemmatimonadaceae bacterium]|nr:glycosyltransferase family 1 protein [Gemmatimonadaceae bacterium]